MFHLRWHLEGRGHEEESKNPWKKREEFHFTLKRTYNTLKLN
jgi:hypothetical protein